MFKDLIIYCMLDSSADGTLEFKAVDEKTLLCLKCFKKFNRVLIRAHLAAHKKDVNSKIFVREEESWRKYENLSASNKGGTGDDSHLIPQKRRRPIKEILKEIRKMTHALNLMIRVAQRSQQVTVLHFFRKMKKMTNTE